MRIGHGFDVHAFEEGDHIILGGVKIPHNKKFRAHSDGDVLIHALCDSLLGALALGDIGTHFPDSDEAYKDRDSSQFLLEVYSLIQHKMYQIENIDLTIIAQKPKMAHYITPMREKLTYLLKLKLDQVSVKATTTERLGFIGEEKGIAVHAVTLLQSVEDE
ncbi:MAG: 2-C-methyl-D-erythritol 2,4-cyclodiphosphate synthase [Thiotrichales bacterium]|nr:2-C-methyl-D-erythritol 2,4-cyclodiphosphate synthase [Thiotrichales bacterium]MBT3613838.1 2-C-methyl-D-erythritol 2,4-cyclodiphosphate synthase [Thiotrichales bacterium]MBT3752843.1 2-C-methyl-D-erythritol 2,4-cyclodiphosphate synthase [Thiotrichales bacterium]MBT3838249.1 2-C-methyl-D-erythritol 2,4-cyclodiphosphate synthase [Thiotrichales bacterium]MBT4151450.1 2-C-methyl-D-erythritol 2,4-cyclodiphosphate synthase [Thiotrichales bacterium]